MLLLMAQREKGNENFTVITLARLEEVLMLNGQLIMLYLQQKSK